MVNKFRWRGFVNRATYKKHNKKNNYTFFTKIKNA